MTAEGLLVSLTEGYFFKISYEGGKYTGKSVKSAALLYKLLIKNAIKDTRANTYQFRSSFDNLENYTGTENSTH